MATNTAIPASMAILGECRDLLCDRLAALARNAGLRDAGALSALRQGAADHFDSLVKGGASDFEQAGNLTASKIRLVDDDQLEFAIALTELSGELAEHCGAHLARLQQRMMTLLDTDRYEAEANPVGAATICAGIDAACAEAGGSLDDLRNLLGHFRTALLAELPLVYAALDDLLLRRRVDPRALLRGAPDGAGRGHAAGVGGQARGDAFAALQGALANRQRGAAQDVGTTRGVVVDPAIAAMLLERALGELDAAQRVGDAAGSGRNLLRDMKQARVAPQLDAPGSASFDALEMVFDEIFSAPELPDAVKVILGRLQIPLLKVALIDPGLFGDAAHPARRLLDAMATASAALPPTTAGDHPVCVMLRSAAAVVQAEFERDVGVFERVGNEIRAWSAAQDQQRIEAARRYLPLAESAERSELARRRAEAAIAHIDRSVLPAVLRDFLDSEWVSVLAAVGERSGEQGEAWQQHLDVARDLVWSVEPKTAPEDRQRLLGLLPRLLGRLNAGLDLIGVAPDARAPLLDAFVGMHSAALRGKAAQPSDMGVHPAADADRPRSPALQRHMLEGADGARLEVLRLAGNGSPAAASAAPVGALVRFGDPAGDALAGQVAWVGPGSGLMLLTHPGWDHARAITAEALVWEAEQGHAAIHDTRSLFESAAQRALRLCG